MRAGQLNKVIRVEKPITITNKYGEEITEYTTEFITKAKVSFNSSNKELVNSETVFSEKLTFTIRSYNKVDSNMIIVYKSKKYRILSINNTSETETIIEGEQIND